MKDGSTVPSYVVGIDLGDRSSRVCVLDTATGEVLTSAARSGTANCPARP